MVLKKSKIKIPYIRLNFQIVRQSDARWCERTAVSHRLLLDLEKIQTFISGGQQICLSGVSFSNSKILYMDFTWHCRGFDLVAVK